MKRSALITGAAGGIGQALCAGFKEAGYAVIATDLASLPGTTETELQADLHRLCEEPSYGEAVLGDIRRVLPSGGLHVLVNNAAVQILHRTADYGDEDWRRTLNVNVVAPFLLVQGLLAELERARGVVINIGSVHATATKPGFVWYATSKAALVGLTRALAIDLGGRLRVVAINPAATATPMLKAGFEGKEASFRQLACMYPVGRIAEPEEIAKAAVFLASEQAAFLTGSAISLDGGILARLHDPE